MTVTVKFQLITCLTWYYFMSVTVLWFMTNIFTVFANWNYFFCRGLPNNRLGFCSISAHTLLVRYIYCYQLNHYLWKTECCPDACRKSLQSSWKTWNKMGFFIWSNLRYKWFFLHCLCSIIISKGQKEDVFLLGGSDKKVHLYKEVRLKILKSLGDIC